MNADGFDDVDPFDDEEDQLPCENSDQSPVAGPADPLFGGVDVAALAGELIGPAVRRAVTVLRTSAGPVRSEGFSRSSWSLHWTVRC